MLSFNFISDFLTALSHSHSTPYPPCVPLKFLLLLCCNPINSHKWLGWAILNWYSWIKRCLSVDSCHLSEVYCLTIQLSCNPCKSVISRVKDLTILKRCEQEINWEEATDMTWVADVCWVQQEQREESKGSKQEQRVQQ